MTALRSGQRITIHVPPSVPPRADDGYLVLRSEPNGSAPPLRRTREGTEGPYHVLNGDTVTVGERGTVGGGNWTQITTADGQTGYIRTRIGGRDMFRLAPPLAGAEAPEGPSEPPTPTRSCGVFVASYINPVVDGAIRRDNPNGQSVVIRSVASGVTQFHVLEVARGNQDDIDRYIAARAPGGQVIRRYNSPSQAMEATLAACRGTDNTGTLAAGHPFNM